MKIIRLDPTQFDNFSINHPLHTYFQSSSYANLMTMEGFIPEYYGFLNDQNILIGASLILIKKLFLGYKYAYAPRGFLLNYEDRQSIVEITNQLRQFFAQNNIIFLKIDPPVINNKRDKNGNILPSQYTNDLIPFLIRTGYSYFGDNKDFATLKPRWNAILKVTGSSETLFNNFDANVKNKIRKAQSRGVEIIQGNHGDINTFYNYVSKKHYRKLEYYRKFAESFGNSFELYFAKLNTEKYLTNIKKIYEQELQRNEEINEEIRNAGISGRINSKITNSKMDSDSKLSKLKNELENASAFFSEHPNGILIASCAVIVGRYGVTLLIEGQDQNYKLFYPLFLTKWAIIEKYAKLGAVFFDLNAITGYFSDNSKFQGLNEMKLGFGAEVTEYIGEFDLVIRRPVYNLHKKMNLGKKSMNKFHNDTK